MPAKKKMNNESKTTELNVKSEACQASGHRPTSDMKSVNRLKRN